MNGTFKEIWMWLPHKLKKKLYIICLMLFLILLATYLLGFYTGINTQVLNCTQQMNTAFKDCLCI